MIKVRGNLNRILLVLIITLMNGFMALAQDFPFDYWHEGRVVLISGDTLQGMIKYNIEGDAIQVENNEIIQAYSSQKILFFEIYDELFESYRQFYSLPYHVKSDYKIPILFEVLYEGPMTLLAREYTVEETIPQYGYYYRGSNYATRTRLAFDYYFLNLKGHIEKFSLKKNDLYDILSKKSIEIKKYMKKNRLRHDKREDLVRIVAYYNSLLES